MSVFLRELYTLFFPGVPTFTEDVIPDQQGKVFIVTGGNAGLGYEIVRILYAKGAKVYMFSRSKAKAEEAIASIKKVVPRTDGDIKIILVDLGDLTTIKPAVNAFVAQESRLDVLFNNAGIGPIPGGTKTTQNYEGLVGTNCLGPFLLTKLLLPHLQTTAKSSALNSVRVVWTGSGAIELVKLSDVKEENLATGSNTEQNNYGISKLGNNFLASELSRRVVKDGIISVCNSPGNLKTKIWDAAPWLLKKLMSPTQYPAVYGASTALWAGLSAEVTVADGGRYVVPWGKWSRGLRGDFVAAMLSKEEGGTGEAAMFWGWCEAHSKDFA